MKKNKTIIVILLFISLYACKSNQVNYKYIHKDTDMVLVFDLLSMAKKARLREYKDIEIYSNIIDKIKHKNKTNKTLLELIEKPESTGIDFTKGLLLYTDMKSKTIMFSVSLSNKENLKKLLLKNKKNKFGKKKGFEYIVEDGNKHFVFNDEIAILIASKKYFNIEQQINKLTNLNHDGRITSTQSFKKFDKNRKDLSIWFSSNFMFDNSRKGGKLLREMFSKSMMVDPKGSNVTMHVDFKNDKLNVNTNFIPNNNLKKVLKDKGVFVKNMNSNLFRFLPKSNLITLGLSIDSKKLMNNLAKDGEKIDKILRQFLNPDILNCLKGNFVFALHSLDKNMDPKISFVFDVKNMENLKKIFKSKYKSSSNKNTFITEDNLNIVVKNGVCLLSNQYDNIEKVIDQGISNNLKSSTLSSNLLSNSIYMNMNFDKSKYQSDKLKNNKLIKILSFFKGLDLYVNHNEKISYDISLRMKDNKNSSLFDIIELILKKKNEENSVKTPKVYEN